MNIKQHNINDLIFAEYNPRQLTKEQYKNLKDSIKRFGLVDPVIINKNKERKNIVIGGHQRLKIAKDLKIEKIPCVELDLTIDQEKELNVRLNKNTGEWDWDALGNYFDVESLIDWGFTNEELQFETPDVVGLTDEDDIPKKVTPRTKLGDIWILGNHKLLCGDATIKEDVEQLLNGKKADMVFTDPPYNVGFNGRSGKFNVIKNDNLKENEFNNFINSFLSILKILKIKTYYICCNWAFYGVLQLKLKPKTCIVWAKNVFGLGKGYRHQHEFILFNGHIKKEITNESDLWSIAKDSKYKHPTQKPVELAKRAIKNSSNVGNMVLDFFGGSGSTLIASEVTARKCYMMELDPVYCDVIVQRWEDYTGKKAILMESASA